MPFVPSTPAASKSSFFKIKVGQLQKEDLSVCLYALSCVIIGNFLWFVAAMLEVGRMINLWICPVSDLFLVQCSIDLKGALAPFLLQPPAGSVVKEISSDAFAECGLAAVPCHCLPA